MRALPGRPPATPVQCLRGNGQHQSGRALSRRFYVVLLVLFASQCAALLCDAGCPVRVRAVRQCIEAVSSMLVHMCIPLACITQQGEQTLCCKHGSRRALVRAGGGSVCLTRTESQSGWQAVFVNSLTHVGCACFGTASLRVGPAPVGWAAEAQALLLPRPRPLPRRPRHLMPGSVPSCWGPCAGRAVRQYMRRVSSMIMHVCQVLL